MKTIGKGMHTHGGLYLFDGRMRSHPVTQKHRDTYTLKMHNQEVGKAPRPYHKKATTQKIFDLEPPKFPLMPTGVEVADGFVYVFVDKLPKALLGVRIRFVKLEKNGKLFGKTKKRTVGLEILK